MLFKMIVSIIVILFWSSYPVYLNKLAIFYMGKLKQGVLEGEIASSWRSLL
jgi:hypothetical protein